LEGEQQADDGGQKEEGAKQVKLRQLLLPGEIVLFLDGTGSLEEDQHEKESDCTDG
jgi:hypothetical protein